MRYMITDDVLPSLTAFGTPFFYVPFLIVLRRFSPTPEIFYVTLTAIVLTELIGAAIKLIFPTERPKARARGSWFRNVDAGSFPSIHSARAAVLATTMVFIGKDIWIDALSIVLALGVGWSRIGLKHHYLRDVIAGLALGIIVTMSVHHFA